LVAVVLAVVLAGTGCQQIRDFPGQGLEGTTIAFSVKINESDRPAIEELLGRFERQTGSNVNLQQLSRFRKPLGPKVKLISRFSPEELITRLSEDAATGKSTIQLFAQNDAALSVLVQRNLVMNLRDIVQVPKEPFDGPFPGSDVRGTRYFLPFHPKVRLAYGSVAAFKSAGAPIPASEEGLMSAARALKGPGAPKVLLPLTRGEPGAMTASALILAYGGNPLILNDAGSVEAFSSLQQLWQEGLLVPGSFQATWETEVAGLANGTIALVENGSVTSTRLAQTGRLQNFFVQSGWSGPDEVHVIGGEVLGIPRDVKGKQLQAAVELAEFLMSKPSQELLARRNAWPSFRRDVNEDQSLPADQRATFAAIQTALDHGWYRPAVAYWPQVSELLNKAIEAIVLGGQPVQPVLDQLHDQIQASAAHLSAAYP
jgi:trehalose transport system substrate-binding protein